MLAIVGALTLATELALPSIALAQQPLEQFLETGKRQAFDAREARAYERQAEAQLGEARGRLLPSFTAQGSYRRNQYDAIFSNPLTMTDIVIQPLNALSLTLQLNVPLVHAGAWAAFFQRAALADAAEAQRAAAEQAVATQVVQTWHQLVAARAFVQAAERNLAVMQQNLEASTARVEVGAAPQLELARAQAEAARVAQGVAEARLQATLLARRLHDLTGVAPNDTQQPLATDLDPQKPLETFLARAAEHPAVRAAKAQARAANVASDMAWTVFLPVLNAYAVESGSNAAGFTGENWTYALGLNATWQLDFAQPAQIAQAKAAADLAAVRKERTGQQIEEALFESWQRVETARAGVLTAQATVAASRRAADDARARFETGAATQLDLIQAEREAFQADVGLIQAFASLRIWRWILDLQAGLASTPAD